MFEMEGDVLGTQSANGSVIEGEDQDRLIVVNPYIYLKHINMLVLNQNQLVGL